MNGLGVDALLAFFFVVCGVPGTFSVWALDITLTGWQKWPVRRLHLISHTITLPSLAPVAKMTEKETCLIRFAHYYRKNVSAFEAKICYIMRQKTIAKAHLCYYQARSNGNKSQPGPKTWEMKFGQEFSFCCILLSWQCTLKQAKQN